MKIQNTQCFAASFHYFTIFLQFDSFGNHGFAGDIKLDFDVEVEGGAEMVTKDGYFAHFYHGPPASSAMRGIPMHVLILVSISPILFFNATES